MLYTKCIFKLPNPEDGVRISVMSRHTLNDGVTKDKRITQESFDLHLSELGPSPKLIGAYYKQEISWNEFKNRYRLEIADSKKQNILKFILYIAATKNVTLLCVEDTHDKCHRGILTEELQKITNIEVTHR